MRSFFLLAALLLAATLAATSEPAGAQQSVTEAGSTARFTLDDPIVSRREYELAQNLRCLVCQNESIAKSNAPLAVELREVLREQVAAGRSDEEITAFMTARYGDFVLFRPPLRASTAVLWFGPFALLALGAFIAFRVLRTRRELAAQEPLSESDRARAAELLRSGESAK